MVEQATFLSLKLEFENMIMSMLIINPASVMLHLLTHKSIKAAEFYTPIFTDP